MPVYALYIPSARRSVFGIEMERFGSGEDASRTLVQRNNTKRSPTFYVTDRERSSDQQRGFFQEADKTGYMRVFLRGDSDPVPDLLDVPDEEWFLERGGDHGQGVVIRIPWMDGDEEVTVRHGCLRVDLPDSSLRQADTVPEYEVRKPAGVQQDREPCGSCFIVPSTTGRCICS